MVLLNVGKACEWWLLSWLACGLAPWRRRVLCSSLRTICCTAPTRHRPNGGGYGDVWTSSPPLPIAATSVRVVAGIGTNADGGLSAARRSPTIGSSGACSMRCSLVQRARGRFRSTSGTQTQSDATALLFFTSGTTGAPKMAAFARELWPGAAGAVLARPPPGRPALEHERHRLGEGGLELLLRALDNGRGRVSGRRPGLRRRAHAAAAVRLPRTSFCAAPTAYRLLVQQPLANWRLRERACSSLRHCASAGEPHNPEVIETWRAHGTDRARWVRADRDVPPRGVVSMHRARPGSMGRRTRLRRAGFGQARAGLRRRRGGDIAVRVAGGEGSWRGGRYNGYLGDRSAQRHRTRRTLPAVSGT